MRRFASGRCLLGLVAVALLATACNGIDLDSLKAAEENGRLVVDSESPAAEVTLAEARRLWDQAVITDYEIQVDQECDECDGLSPVRHLVLDELSAGVLP
ncbi:MAG: hypothetical protein ACI8Y4_003975 [Candidatus Poriferisodalaceae bacterium]|jgi:hypothetical protein